MIKMEERFFKTVLGTMLFFLMLCIVQFVNIEYRYEVLNFLENRKILALSPRQVARQYILALKKKDYKIAHNYLTHDSQERFSLADFVSMNEGSMTIMNENKTWIYYEEIRVGIQIYEDPGWWGYVFVKNKGRWRISMYGGIPSYPFSYDGGKCAGE